MLWVTCLLVEARRQVDLVFGAELDHEPVFDYLFLTILELLNVLFKLDVDWGAVIKVRLALLFLNYLHVVSEWHWSRRFFHFRFFGSWMVSGGH